MTELSTADGGTVSSDYASAYYHGQLGPPYEYDEPHWQRFFGGIADRIVELFGPTTSYDAGCAKGFLVRELAARGVDARGGDISEFAVTGAPPGLRERLEVKNLTEPFADRFDLITCIEVLEHMEPDDARAAIANLCAATDRILLSSTPDDFAEATHINVRQPASWAQEFAMHGFFRCADIDASFVSPWAVIFERATLTLPQLVSRYEGLIAPTLREMLTKRRTVLELRRELDEGVGPLIIERDDAVRDLEALRLSRMQAVDENLGLKAQLAEVTVHAEYAVHEARLDVERFPLIVAGLEADLAAARAELAAAEERLAGTSKDHAQRVAEAEARASTAEQELDAVRRSWSWRIGNTVVRPLSKVRRKGAPQ